MRRRLRRGLIWEERRCGKADFIGACVSLRGCANSLLEIINNRGNADKRNEWKKALTKFLVDIDFVLKHHAAVKISQISRLSENGN